MHYGMTGSKPVRKTVAVKINRREVNRQSRFFASFSLCEVVGRKKTGTDSIIYIGVIYTHSYMLKIGTPFFRRRPPREP